MKTYAELEQHHFYLLIENEGEEIILAEPVLFTQECVLLVLHDDDVEIAAWRKKTDEIFEFIEELTEDLQEEYETLFAQDEEDEEDEE